MDTASNGFKLIDAIAQRGNYSKYTWNDSNKLECLLSASGTAQMLISEFGLPKPEGFDECVAIIEESYNGLWEIRRATSGVVVSK